MTASGEGHSGAVWKRQPPASATSLSRTSSYMFAGARTRDIMAQIWPVLPPKLTQREPAAEAQSVLSVSGVQAAPAGAPVDQ